MNSRAQNIYDNQISIDNATTTDDKNPSSQQAQGKTHKTRHHNSTNMLRCPIMHCARLMILPIYFQWHSRSLHCTRTATQPISRYFSSFSAQTTSIYDKFVIFFFFLSLSDFSCYATATTTPFTSDLISFMLRNVHKRQMCGKYAD